MSPGSGVECRVAPGLVELPVHQGPCQQGISRQVDRDEHRRDAGSGRGLVRRGVTFNDGRPIRGGFYLFTIRDSSNGDSSVAGHRRQPSGRRVLRHVPLGQRHHRLRLRCRALGLPQQDLRAADDRREQPATPTAAWAARRSGAVHSGDFAPVTPRGSQLRYSQRKRAARRRPEVCQASGPLKLVEPTVKASHSTTPGVRCTVSCAEAD